MLPGLRENHVSNLEHGPASLDVRQIASFRGITSEYCTSIESVLLEPLLEAFAGRVALNASEQIISMLARQPKAGSLVLAGRRPAEGVPGLEIFSPERGWINPGKDWGLTRSDVIVMPGVFMQVPRADEALPGSPASRGESAR